MEPGSKALVFGLGGALAGWGLTTGLRGKRSPYEALAVGIGAVSGAILAAGTEAVAATTTVTPLPSGPENASSTNSLNHGWVYFLTLIAPNGVDVGSLGKYLQSVGFIDPTTKGPPALTVPYPTVVTTLALYSGVTGTAIPPNSASLLWQSVLGYPNPEGLATV